MIEPPKFFIVTLKKGISSFTRLFPYPGHVNVNRQLEEDIGYEIKHLDPELKNQWQCSVEEVSEFQFVKMAENMQEQNTFL